MSSPSKMYPYNTLTKLAQRLRADLNDLHCVLLYACNRTGKRQLSMEFKDQGKRNGNRDTPSTSR